MDVEPLLVGSDWLVSVTITDCCELIVVGAVYRPPVVTVPTPPGVMDQVTAWFDALATGALNCCVCDEYRGGPAGGTATAIGGLRRTLAQTVFVRSCRPAAATATGCWLLIGRSAVDKAPL